jgi:hypothetical protein
MIEIKEIDWGIACRVGNVIYINKNLIKQDVPLYYSILNHELSHSPRFSWKDVKIDLKNNDLKGLKGKYYKFILKNPKSLIEFLPLWKYDKKLVVNPLILALYGIFLIILGGILLIL